MIVYFTPLNGCRNISSSFGGEGVWYLAAFAELRPVLLRHLGSGQYLAISESDMEDKKIRYSEERMRSTSYPLKKEVWGLGFDLLAFPYFGEFHAVWIRVDLFCFHCVLILGSGSAYLQVWQHYWDLPCIAFSTTKHRHRDRAFSAGLVGWQSDGGCTTLMASCPMLATSHLILKL